MVFTSGLKETIGVLAGLIAAVAKKPGADFNSSPPEAITVLKAVADYSGTLVSWALAWAGGSMVAFISTSYERPKTQKRRLIYLSFPFAWISLGVSVYLGQQISRRYLAAIVSSPGADVIDKILAEVNDEFIWQLRCTQLGLFFLALWLGFMFFFFITAPASNIDEHKAAAKEISVRSITEQPVEPQVASSGGAEEEMAARSDAKTEATTAEPAAESVPPNKT
jgi:hypothetical protein